MQKDRCGLVEEEYLYIIVGRQFFEHSKHRAFARSRTARESDYVFFHPVSIPFYFYKLYHFSAKIATVSSKNVGETVKSCRF
jgi:hypothetical protein